MSIVSSTAKPTTVNTFSTEIIHKFNLWKNPLKTKSVDLVVIRKRNKKLKNKKLKNPYNTFLVSNAIY